MAIKFIVIPALIAIVNAGNLAITPYSTAYQQSQFAPTYIKTVGAPIYKPVEYEAPAKYDFSYSVNDPHTGDVKEQSESRHGDVVRGYYSLIDADGFRRIVEYTADAHNGFNAVVRREPLGHIAAVPVANKIITPAAYATPTVSSYIAASPINYYNH